MMLTLDHLLADNCPNPVTEPGLEPGDQPSYCEYIIDLHCVRYTVYANRLTDGEWDRERMVWIEPPHYEVVRYEAEYS